MEVFGTDMIEFCTFPLKSSLTTVEVILDAKCAFYMWRDSQIVYCFMASLRWEGPGIRSLPDRFCWHVRAFHRPCDPRGFPDPVTSAVILFFWPLTQCTQKHSPRFRLTHEASGWIWPTCKWLRSYVHSSALHVSGGLGKKKKKKTLGPLP